MPPPSRTAMHLLVPAAASRSPAVAAALPHLRLPHLQALLNQLTPTERLESDEQTWSMPYEQVVARAMGIPAEAGHIPWAALESQSWGTPCAWIKPCHWQVGSDRILMGDPQALQLQEAESRALLAAMQPWFAEDGITLRYLALPGAWLASGEVFRSLPTASLERVVGRNIDSWLPPASTAQGATLRRLQNEMQMLLYTHPLNDAREERGLPVVNSFWITGAGVLDTPVPHRPELLIEPRLCAPGLQHDTAAWAAAWHAIDADSCARLLEGVQQKQDIRLTLCGDQVAQSWRNTRTGPWQRITGIFGRRPASDILQSL